MTIHWLTILKPAAVLLIVAVLGAFIFSGCKSPERAAYTFESGVEITVDEAMQGWAAYVAQFHPPADQEAKVKAIYTKYQAAALALVDVTSLASNLNPTEAAAQKASAEQAVAQCLAELITAIRSFGVKL